jgi:hypothetical protein
MSVAEEAQRYLKVVDFFRAEGCEPHWQPEPVPPPTLTQEVSSDLESGAARERAA